MRGRGQMVFFVMVFAAYSLAGIFRPELLMPALTGFGAMVIRIVPVLVVVFIILFCLNLLLNPAWIRKNLGQGAGLRGWLFAVLGGILLMGPPYVLYPMLGEFRRHGAKDSLLAVFLYNRNVKIPFLPVMYYYFGLSYTVVLSLYIILFSLVSGAVMAGCLQKAASPALVEE